MSCRCDICPNRCLIKENDFGICGVRKCVDNQIILPYYGRLSALSVDPIEKKPLYHFYPGSTILSAGFYGCSLSCPFCQNFRISKEFPQPAGAAYSPQQLINASISEDSFAIAYTYSEPVVHYEYIIETSELASAKGLKNVLVTNGYINNTKANKLLANIDAVNIDLKSFSNDFYRMELGGRLEPVLDFIRAAADSVHTEVTTLVIPGKNDSLEEISAEAGFLASVDKNIVYHLSAYYPAYKYSAPPTDPGRLVMLAEKASEYLPFVFTGNITGGIQNTKCPSCGNELINRSAYHTRITGIADGLCSNCKTDISELGIIL